MANNYDSKIHHRRSTRLKGYDCCVGGIGLPTGNAAGTTPAARQAGAYFVTVVAYRRECLLGEVVDGTMGLNEFGIVVAKT